MDELRTKRNIMCIDLKSFFAFVECVERGIDPYTTPLIVCNPEQKGAISLAVTPYLKSLGIPGRVRVYDIQKNIKYIKVPPRMSLYQKKSKEVIGIYLKYVAKEDLHVYSIDECFLDVTNYLKMYNMSDYELALTILKDIKESTGLVGTAGIGPNMLLAKISMDIEAKHTKDNIAKWTYEDVETNLWNIKPLSKMWGIGSNLEKRLNSMNIYSVKELALTPKEKLIKEFGVLGGDLYYRANGIDLTKLSDLNDYKPKEKSISNSQVLFKDYFDFNIDIIIYEIIDTLCRRLRKEKLLCGLISLGITSSKTSSGSFHHSLKLNERTDNANEIFRTAMYIFNHYYTKFPIRKVAISFGNLSPNDKIQLDIFEDYEEIKKRKQIEETIDEVKERFGPNSILKASSLLSDSTIKERNGLIGGHKA